MTLALTIPGLFVFMVLQFIPNLPVWAYAVCNFMYWAINGRILHDSVRASLGDEQQQRPARPACWYQPSDRRRPNIVVSILNTYLFSVWGQDSWESFFKMALIYGIFTVVVLVIGLLTIQEHPYDETTDFSDADANDSSEKVPLLKRIPLIVWN